MFTGTITGLTNGDDIAASYSTTATSSSPAGTYPIIPSLVDPNNRETNYTVTLVNGTLTVDQGTGETIAWTNPAPITYGTTINSNQLSATANVPGIFTFNPTNGTVLTFQDLYTFAVFTPTDTVNYSTTTNTVSLVVLPAPLTVTAANASRPYGGGTHYSPALLLAWPTTLTSPPFTVAAL